MCIMKTENKKYSTKHKGSRRRYSSSSSDENSRPSKRHYENSTLYKTHSHNHKPEREQKKHQPLCRPTDFSFVKYRFEINRVFVRHNELIEDIEDLWLFVKKYETLNKTSEDRNFGKHYKC